jgi:carboxyl-terminal processing protease
MSNNKSFYEMAYKPLTYALLIATGTVIGISVSKMSAEKHRTILGQNSSKINEIMEFVKYKYVDTLSDETLEEKTIEQMLASLDPHSVYIPQREISGVNEELDGNFEGIGVEFYIVKDTITVVTAISGGPSELIGLRAGDKIVKINDTTVAGIGIKNQDVMRKLKGPGGTLVKVGIKRANEKTLKEYTITRGKIPIFSIDAAYEIEPGMGYIKINKFSAETASEFKKALRSLTDKNIDKLIIDLRQNPGGYLQAATEILDELIGGEKILVYTQGKSVGKFEYYSKRPGLFERGKLAVLIDQNSASASEIISGAVQDWDRGLVIGRTSFGKGLVQEQFQMRDGSALRLTVARYFTPSGRSIQRPYNNGTQDYYEDVFDRYNKGMFLSEDTTILDSLKFKTASGRVVYGGGGIRPDIFVPIDTTEDLDFLFKIRTIIPEFIYSDYSSNPEKLDRFKDMYDFKQKFEVPSSLLENFKTYAVKNGVTDEKKFGLYTKKIEDYIKAFYAKQKWKSDGYFMIANQNDKVIQKTLLEIKK